MNQLKIQGIVNPKLITSGRDAFIYKGFVAGTNREIILKRCKYKDYSMDIIKSIRTLSDSWPENVEKIFDVKENDQNHWVDLYCPLLKITLADTTFSEHEDFLRKQQRIVKTPVKILAQMIWEFLNGLAFLHSTCKIIHGDIRSPNIMFDFSGRLVIIDLIGCYKLESAGDPCFRSYFEERHKDLFLNPHDWSTKIDLWAFATLMFDFYFYPLSGLNKIVFQKASIPIQLHIQVNAQKTLFVQTWNNVLADMRIGIAPCNNIDKPLDRIIEPIQMLYFLLTANQSTNEAVAAFGKRFL